MTDKTGTAFHEELRSFFALALLNIVFAALTLAFGISIVVNQALALLAAGTVQAGPAAYLLLGASAAVVGLWWIPKSVEVFGDVEEIQEEEASADRSPEEALRLMVRMMALYRDQREVIGRMVLVSGIGGALFVLVSVFNLIGLVAQVVGTDGATEPFTIPIGIAGIAVTTGMGVAALVVSALFRKYSAAWDARLAESDRMDALLDQTMEQE